jgi:DNA-binding NarL/FixJ family response regulator
MVRILIADDHEVVRFGLRRLIAARPDWHVVAEASDGKDAINQAVATKPDVAIVDYAMPLSNGVETTREIRARLPSTEVLIFTLHDDERLISELLYAGARGYVLKSDAGCQLLEAIEALALHRPFFTAKVRDAILASFLSRSERDAIGLTARQRSVVQLLAEGHRNKQIANLLDMHCRAVEGERAQIMRKLGVSSIAGVVLYAIRNGLIEP